MTINVHVAHEEESNDVRASEVVTRDSISFAVSFAGGTQSLLSKENSFSSFSHFISDLSSILKFNLEVNPERELVLQENTKENKLKTAQRNIYGSEVLQHHKSNFDHSNT